jgi:hypothetical protein
MREESKTTTHHQSSFKQAYKHGLLQFHSSVYPRSQLRGQLRLQLLLEDRSQDLSEMKRMAIRRLLNP